MLPAGDPALAPAPGDLGSARAVVDAYRASNAQQQRTKAEVLAYIDAHPDALDRTCLPGHLTTSAAVLDSTGERVLLMLHRKLERWLQMGGHADGDGNLAGSAVREAAEESGITGLVIDPDPVDIDIHPLPIPGHDLHLDIRFLVVAPPGAIEHVNEESLALQWFPVDDLHDLDASGHRLIRAAVARFRSKP